MNSETGEIKRFDEIIKLPKAEQAKYIPIDEQLMTEKQRTTQQVSKFDGQSALGKIRVKHRNSLRNQPCPCGSGIKFKWCCWDKTC
ncbi:MAG: SEC-C metal-binding domain-containing protein [Phycisphaerae bacterium]|nr:SEC-C metal-binding domain-containing protein [Phycisphaerae bacterium]